MVSRPHGTNITFRSTVDVFFPFLWLAIIVLKRHRFIVIDKRRRLISSEFLL